MPDGSEPNRPYLTYAEISPPDIRRSMLTQVYECLMPPPASAPPLGTDERQALLAWLVCGGPNN